MNAETFAQKLGLSLYAAAGMLWEIFWALVLGFALSGVVMAFVPKKKIARALGRSGAKELGIAAFFGMISSSCSYAAAAMARSLFQKGAHIVPALAFMLASTNLVIELSAVLWVLMGWQFVVAELVGGLILILIMAALMRFFGPLKAFEEKQQQLSHGDGGSLAADDEAADWRTLEGWRKAARAFVMEWRMIWQDIVIGVVVSGFLMVLVPDRFWQALFLQNQNGVGSASGVSVPQIVENALVGPLVSVVSFVCSVGNIPLASVLYHGGIAFGGAISFIYADLIIIPMILVYRRYYGGRLALWIAGIFYVAMVAAGILVELLFKCLGWTPERRAMGELQHLRFFEMNYTFWLNIAFFIAGAALVWLARSGGGEEEAAGDCCHH